MTRAFNGIFVDDVWVINANIEDETFECAYCGERHLRGAYDENVYECEGAEICETCAEDDTFICERCGERHHIDDATRVFNCGYAEHWCTDCTSDYAFYCEDCEEYFTESEINALGDGYYVCDECLADHYEECSECGEWVLRDDCTFTGDVWVCDECRDEHYTYDADEDLWLRNEVYAERYGDNEPSNSVTADDVEDSNEVARSGNARVRGYHSRPTWWNEFMGARNALSNTAYAGIGVELEVDVKEGERPTYRQRALNRIDRITNSNRVYFNDDCSLRNGFEIISRPHTIEAFNEIPWAEIMDACKENGFSSHDAGTCGLHFHFSRLMFGDDEDTQDDNIAKLVQFFEFYWDDLVKVSRREGNQLRWCGKKGYVSKKRIKDYVKEKYGGHDEAINNANRDTVEVRIMRGTLNIDTFNASLDLLLTLIKNACRIGWDEVSEADEMLKGIKSETADYLLRRNAFYREAYHIRYNG